MHRSLLCVRHLVRADFAQFLDPEEMQACLNRAAELMADASRLTSFLALRKLDDFLRGSKAKADDLITSSSCPTGKSAKTCPVRAEKIFLFFRNANQSISSRVSPD
ncbi:hypothetical protein OZ411_00130 [Bradyrhizobium sp. Arg237L]|uniref:hypothetical protein n=1 Tax=Bradyrhizobium sp. Arg237L TaxID=3003352 RepID=UPI00249F68C8|nr:hypothetical protein [Bradyrhizobium sp. Arg237L]MDI4231218.1 hypothetical protein [Bradyrhizobium sp. Arg237L]